MMKLEEKFGLIDVPATHAGLSVVRAEFLIEGEQVLIGRDGSGNQHFLVRDPSSSTGRGAIEHMPEGLSINWRLLEDNLLGGERQSYFDFSCTNRIELTLFCAIIEELISKVTKIEELARELSRIIEEWGELLAFPKLSRLTAESEIGLFGELWVLANLVSNRNDLRIDAWTGPLGSRHDFELHECSLEVKTNLLRRQHMVSIHGEHQLERSGVKDLYLVALRVEPDSSGISILDLLEMLRSMLAHHQRQVLEQLFSQMGLNLEVKEWTPLHFRVHSVKCFLVDANFPKVVRRDLDLLPAGSKILRIAYDLLLDDLIAVSYLHTPRVEDDFSFWGVAIP